jgi:hypothetical protein
METAGSSETLVTIHQITQRRIPQDSSLSGRYFIYGLLKIAASKSGYMHSVGCLDDELERMWKESSLVNLKAQQTLVNPDGNMKKICSIEHIL